MKKVNKPFCIGVTPEEHQFNEKTLSKSTVEVFGKVDIEKSIINMLNGPEGSVERLAFAVDPVNQYTYAGVYKPITRLVPNVVKKRIAIQDSLVSNIVRARQNHMFTFGKPRPDRYSLGYVIEPFPGVLDAMNEEQKTAFSKKCDKAIAKLNTCGDTEGRKAKDIKSFAEWISLCVRDAEVMGYIATEAVYKTDVASNEKVFHYFAHVDSGTIYQATEDSDAAQQALRNEAFDLLERVTGKDDLIKEKFKGNDYDWVQVIDGTPRMVFTDKELKVANFYPVGNVELDGYPVSPIDTVISAITTHLSITTHNRLYFQSGRATRGMLIIKSDDVTPQVVHNIKQNFNACIAGKTKIVTKELGEVSVDELLEGADRKKVTIWTGRDWQSAEVYKTGEKELVRTKLANGIDISTSPDHRFLTVGTDGLVWKEQKDLHVGDYVCVNRKEIEDDTYIPDDTLVSLAKQVLEFDNKDKLLPNRRRDKLTGIIRGERGASRKYLLDLMSEAGFTPPKWLLQYNFEPVTEKIATGNRVEMFDATVDDEEHTFLADGIVTHNSVNGVDKAWRLPVFSVPTDSEITWQPIDTSGSRDMEFQYLTDLNAREILTAFMMSPDELPGWSYLSRGTNSQALSESKGEFQLEAGRDVGLRPLLQTFEAFVNKDIFPLIDPDLAKISRVSFVGLDADSPEKEIVGLQQKSQVYMTMNDIQKVVEKPLLPKEACAEIPLNPVYKSYLDQYRTVGWIMEHFMGIKDASKDPRWDYVRDPLYFQNMQLQMQKQQMEMQAQQAQQQPQQQEDDGSGEPNDLSSGVNQAFEMMNKSEAAALKIPTNKRKLMQQQARAMKWLEDGFKEDIEKATKEILEEVKKVAPRG